jgi:hypothetical protein
MNLSSQLKEAMEAMSPIGGGGFIVKLLEFRHDQHSGMDMAGVLPMVVVGHESMTEGQWREWVRDNGMAHYGAGYTERMLEHGVSMKEMKPTAPLGRAMRVTRDGMKSAIPRTLNEANVIMEMVEKWPSLYNAIAEQLAGKELTLREFVSTVKQMPSPMEWGQGRMITLGDLVGRGIMVLGDY